MSWEEESGSFGGEEAFCAARRGDPGSGDAFAAWLRPQVVEIVKWRMRPSLRRWVDPEDVTQIVLLEALTDVARLPDDAGLEDFLWRVKRTARSRIIDQARKHRRLQGDSTVPERPGRFVFAPRSSGPATQRDERKLLERLIRELPRAYGDVVRLIALERLDVSSAAQRLGLRPATVRKRYDRARRALQRLCQQRSRESRS